MNKCDKNGFGGHVSRAEVCYIPGAKVATGTTFNISSKGIWKATDRFSITPTIVDNPGNHGGSK